MGAALGQHLDGGGGASAGCGGGDPRCYAPPGAASRTSLGGRDAGGASFGVAAAGAERGFLDIHEALHDARENVSEVGIKEVDPAIEEGLGGAFVAVGDGVGATGNTAMEHGLVGGGLLGEGGGGIGGSFAEGIRLRGWAPNFWRFWRLTLGFGAEAEGVDFFLDAVVGPNADGRLEDLDDFFVVGFKRVDGTDA